MACCFLECSLIFPNHDELEKDRLAEEPLLDYENDVEYRKLKCTLSLARFLASLRRLRRWVYNLLTSKGCRKCWCRTLLIIFILLLGTFILLFVVFPLFFKNSIDLQRSLIFHPVNRRHNDYNRLNPDGSCYNGPNVTNSYFTLKNLHLGLWNVSKHYGWFDNSYYRKMRRSNEKPTLIYFHMEDGDRRTFSELYCTLSNYFTVITFDYRGYGDSSKYELVEDGLVDDSVHLYKWVMNHTIGDIYVWGDTLGAAIATHTVSRLYSNNIVLTGLILENPFTTLSEKITTWYWPLGKIFSWMPWYDAFITNPLMENNLSFNTSEYISNVHCPLLIYKKYYDKGSDLTEKFSLIAADRDFLTQGSITSKSVWWTSFGYYGSNLDELNDFIAECVNFKANKTSV